MPEALQDAAFPELQEIVGKVAYEGFVEAVILVLLSARVSVGGVRVWALANNGESIITANTDAFIFNDIDD
ncbi:MAG: hypothetical protein Q7T37_00550 [bacterium]|nr:hypothetical protein [bacterium]